MIQEIDLLIANGEIRAPRLREEYELECECGSTVILPLPFYSRRCPVCGVTLHIEWCLPLFREIGDPN